MKIVGIVAEYNPFHNGHAYQIQRVQELLQPDAIVAIMSGPFVQRGFPAFVDKWTRAEMALSSGVNLVLELPVCFATDSAEGFAYGAVASLASSGVITHLAFGAEKDVLPEFKSLASYLAFPSESYLEALKLALAEGVSFPKARELAIKATYDGLIPDVSAPNAILAIEYLKAIAQLKPSMEPTLIKRIGNGYHDTSCSGIYPSATAIRNAYFTAKDSFDFSQVMPYAAAEILKKSVSPVSINHYEQMLFAILRRSTPEMLNQYRGFGEGIAYKVWDAAQRTTTYEALVETIKSKRYTQTRIQRLLLSALLHIGKNDFSQSPSYLRILGTDATGKRILRNMRRQSTLPIITNVNRIDQHLKQNPQLALDIRAQDLYALGHPLSNARIGAQDRTRTIVLRD